MPATLFTTRNIVGLLQAAPDSDGSLADVCRIGCAAHGCDVAPALLSAWLRKGAEWTARGRLDHPYAIFRAEFEKRLPSRDAERGRNARQLQQEMGQALSLLSATCDCGRPKHRADPACTLCLALDAPPQRVTR